MGTNNWAPISLSLIAMVPTYEIITGDLKEIYWETNSQRILSSLPLKIWLTLKKYLDETLLFIRAVSI